MESLDNIIKMDREDEIKHKVQSMSNEELARLSEDAFQNLCATRGKSFFSSEYPSLTNTDVLLGELIRRFKKTLPEAEPEEEQPVQIGTLNRIIGMVGCEVAHVGHPVFEFQERYIVYLKNEKTGTPASFRYYKETLKPAINFQ